MFSIRKTTVHRALLTPIFIFAVFLTRSTVANAQEIVTFPSTAADATEASTSDDSAPAAIAPKRPADPNAKNADKQAGTEDTAAGVNEDTAEENIFKSDARALSEAFRHAARDATPAVVTVYSYGQHTEKPTASDRSAGNDEITPPDDETFGPTPPPETEDEGFPLTGLGSGVVVDLMPAEMTPKSGDIDAEEKTYWVMTNNHVVADAKRVVVQLPDERELVAERVYGDPDSDIAVLRLSSEHVLATATLGDSDSLEIGDWVLAIGSPFKLEATVCAGIISAKHRSIGKIRRGRLFQTDAAINPGNSGGPLVDLDGEVVAISTAIATRNGGYQGIGFAIPINQAHWIARELAEFQRVRRAAMGVRLAELNPKTAQKLDLPTYLGVLVYQVIKGSAADVAGLQSMDVILEFAGERVRRMSALQQVVEQQPVGSTQDVTISRGGKELTKQIILAPLEDPTALETEPSAE